MTNTPGLVAFCAGKAKDFCREKCFNGVRVYPEAA